MSGRQAVSSPERRRGRARREEPGQGPGAPRFYSGALREGKPGRRRGRGGAGGAAGRPPPAAGFGRPAAVFAPERQHVRRVAVNLEPGQRVGEGRALHQHPAGVWRPARLAQAALQHQHLVDPLDVPARQRQHAQVEAGPALVLHPRRPPGLREAEGHEQAAEQHAVGQRGRRRLERAAGTRRAWRATPRARRRRGRAAPRSAARAGRRGAVRGTCARRRRCGGSCSTPPPGARARPARSAAARSRSRRGWADRSRSRDARRTTRPAASARDPRGSARRGRRCSG